MKINKLLIVLLFLIGLNSCGDSEVSITEEEQEQGQEEENGNENEEMEEEATGLLFVDEFIIPGGFNFEGTEVGGLSGIDFANGSWYLISDSPNSPRFYTANINYDITGFSNLEIASSVRFKDESGADLSDGLYDPESIRVDDNTLVWTSEGNVANQLPPSVNFTSFEGVSSGEANTPSRFTFSENEGPRSNGAFEGLSLSTDGLGFWVNTELPLLQDGPAPTAMDTNSPIRVAFIDRATGNFGREFAYELDAVARPATLGTSFELNGVVEILEYEINKFLFLERSFASGYIDGGYNIKIYEVDATNATDVSAIDALEGADFQVATKTLLLDFEDIRSELTRGMVDNLEGFTFGPNFENGNRSLLVVADNNFNAIVPQLNQFVLLELKE